MIAALTFRRVCGVLAWLTYTALWLWLIKNGQDNNVILTNGLWYAVMLSAATLVSLVGSGLKDILTLFMDKTKGPG
jgi:hypothetical protein